MAWLISFNITSSWIHTEIPCSCFAADVQTGLKQSTMKGMDFHSMPNAEAQYKDDIKELEQQILLLKE